MFQEDRIEASRYADLTQKPSGVYVGQRLSTNHCASPTYHGLTQHRWDLQLLHCPLRYLRFSRGEQPSICQRQQGHLGRGRAPIPKCLCICWRRGTGDTARRREECCCHLDPAVLLENKPEAYGPSKGSDPGDSVVACV